ncbi:MAG: alpha-L-fucosidase [Verrucomicrobiales bacterium]|nr:alpha-L-fucosidase [Verrucomicrobiales bacterium]
MKHLSFCSFAGVVAVLTISSTLARAAGPYAAEWDSLDQRATPEWFLDAKFGVFIHWGLYSVPGWGAPKQYAEWYWRNMADKKPDNPWWQYHQRVWGADFDYAEFAPLFRCENFDADFWADLFARSGAKYIVPTSKHHEGFCLWPSAEASRTWGRPWNAVETGPRRDLMLELKTAVEKRGVKFGFYYSLYEWFNPLWLSDRDRYVNEHMMPQFKDVVSRYAPALIFSDGEWDLPAESWRSEELLAWLFNESPCRDYVVINDRWGKGCRHHHGGYFTTEYAAGMKDASHPWEESRGMAHSYGWNRVESIDDYKSAEELILVLCDLVSRGGNFLLDIGPTGDGRIPVIMQQRLLEIGDWLRVNGEAIYGTRFAGRPCQWTEGRMPEQQFGEYMVKYNLLDQVGQRPNRDGLAVKQVFFTQKPDALYAITAGWPGAQLVLRDLVVPAGATVSLLGRPGALPCEVDAGKLTIAVPRLGPDEAPARYAHAFKITGARLALAGE